MNWDLLNDINYNKAGIGFEDPELIDKGWNKFIFEAILSQHQDAILIVNELNCRLRMSKRMQYGYLFHTLPKRKRFGKLSKAKANEKIEWIMKEYNYSLTKALEVEDLISDEEIEEIKQRHNTGGYSENKKKKKKRG